MWSVSGGRAEPEYVLIRILDLHATTESDRLLRPLPAPPVHLVDECFQADALCGAFAAFVNEREDWENGPTSQNDRSCSLAWAVRD